MRSVWNVDVEIYIRLVRWLGVVILGLVRHSS